uniref:Uncharacterized protein n=1 Tax=Rhizophora mucronata TaxID=61149 RepID=A0A2P2QHI6_RHIMU
MLRPKPDYLILLNPKIYRHRYNREIDIQKAA